MRKQNFTFFVKAMSALDGGKKRREEMDRGIKIGKKRKEKYMIRHSRYRNQEVEKSRIGLEILNI